MAKKEIWKVKGKGKPVIEVYETYNGDLYFIVDKETSGRVFLYARLYSMPQFAEWGVNNINHLKKEYGKNKIWLVSKKNWDNINSYEDGLLVRVK